MRTTERSQRMHEQALSVSPGGVHSNVRLTAPPVFFAEGRGARLIDIDGNDYIDYLLGQGPNLLGHAPEAVNDAVAAAVRRGMVFGAQNWLEVPAGEAVLAALPWAERIRFGVSGSESVHAALRLARAATGRRRHVRFEGHYHGWFDSVLTALQDGRTVPASAGQRDDHLAEALVIPWNDVHALEQCFTDHGDSIAAVITEPIMMNNGAVMPVAGYLERMRELCTANGAVLIFDEVITGFRVHRSGVSGLLGIHPDLAVYGKAIAAGWPVSALVGSADLMDRFANGVNHSGTFNGSVMACAAVVATAAELDRDPPYERMAEHGSQLMNALSALAVEHGLPLRIQGLPMAFHIRWDGPAIVHDYRSLLQSDGARYVRLAERLCDWGVWLANRGIWYVSGAHGPAELDETIERCAGAFAEHAQQA